ncbi:leukotoxin LktA family filamentous adhesin, partial [bacterium]|nr:leukotoxin LktA family filamentous adhesin [bacterium]
MLRRNNTCTNNLRCIKASFLGLCLVLPCINSDSAWGASEITSVYSNITTGQYVSKQLTKDSNGAFNLTPHAVNGKTGLARYSQFKLEQGDVANFIYKAYMDVGGTVDIDTFIAEVNGGKININGIVNTLTDLPSQGGVYNPNGHLVLIAPGGLVVGSSGVLNVGQLSVFTPEIQTYSHYSKYPEYIREIGESYTPAFDNEATINGTPIDKASIAGKMVDISQLTNNPEMPNASSASFENNGLIMSAHGLSVQANNISNSGRIINGAIPNNGSNILDSTDAAEALFASLVNVANNNGYNGNNRAHISLNATKSNTINGQILNAADGNTTIASGADGITFGGTLKNTSGHMTITADGNININDGASVTNYAGDLSLKSEDGAIQISGDLSNANGNMDINAKYSVDVYESGRVNLRGKNTGVSEPTMTINAADMTIFGKIEADDRAAINIGAIGTMYMNASHQDGNGNEINNIKSVGGNVTLDVFEITPYNNYNGDKNKYVNIKTENGANLDITAVGNIGTNYTKNDSKNTGILDSTLKVSVDGNLKATSNNGHVHISSLNKNLKVDTIQAKEDIILIADSYDPTKSNNGSNEAAYDITGVTRTQYDSSTPHLQANGMEVIASGKIGNGTDDPLTIIQDNAYFDKTITREELCTEYTGNGRRTGEQTLPVNILANGDISLRGVGKITTYKNGGPSYYYDDYDENYLGWAMEFDPYSADGMNQSKIASYGNADVEINSIISRNGSVNAEFNGDVYINQVTSNDKVNIKAHGTNMVITHLGETPDYNNGDYFGTNTNNVIPNRAVLTATDMKSDTQYYTTGGLPSVNPFTGQIQDNSKTYYYQPYSTIVVQGGRLKGDGKGRESADKDQDLQLIADHSYADGYEFFNGPNDDRKNIQFVDTEQTNPYMSWVRENDATSTIQSVKSGVSAISVRATAVRPKDMPTGVYANTINATREKPVDPQDPSAGTMGYYYGGSTQYTDKDYDGPNNNSLDTYLYGGTYDDDNLVIPRQIEQKENPPVIDPTSDYPTTDNPTTDNPTTDNPTTDNPTTDNPTTDNPTTDNPTTDNPTTDNPTTDNQTTDNPTTDNPTTDNPTTDNPTTDNPTTDNPTTDNPTTDNPTTDNPTTDNPTTDNPTTDNPTTDNPTTDNPTTDNPTADNPTTDNPTTDNPTTDNPTTDNPTTDNPTTDNPTTDNPT